MLGLLWLTGLGMRVTILAVPPLLPAIGRDLGLSQGTIGTLISLPTLLFAAAAIPGALLIAWVGARRALLTGAALLTAFSAIRGVGPAAPVLFGATFLMAAGAAISQPAIPTLIRDRLPARIGLATAAYSNGMMAGETLPPAITGPLVLPALGGWEPALAVWAAPVAVLLALLLATTRELPAAHPAGPGDAPPAIRRLPDFRNPQLWLIGLWFGLDSAAYWGANAFIPGYVHATGRAELKDAALAVLNAAQLIASLGLLVVARHLVARRLPLVMMGAGMAVGYAGMLLAPGWGIVVFAGLIGLVTAGGMILVLALPPLLAEPADVHTFSAGIFTICYATAFLAPVVGGAVWDATHVAAAPFLLFGAGGLLATVLALLTRYRHSRE
jgi:MFS transporter, CP family, cyanate transporter